MVVIRPRTAMNRFPIPSLPLLLAHALAAAETTEITVEPQPFTIRHSITASALPAEFETIKLDATAWSDFEITSVTPHGTLVSKGDVLLAFDTEKIDEKIHDTRRAIENRKRDIAQATGELAHLKETTPHKLATLRRAAADAAEENEYYTVTRREAEEESADQRLKRAEMFLENQREELRQLEKMYEAEELTEETEEIILHRQRDRVAAAEFELRMEQLRHKRRREVELPREAVELADTERDAGIALAKSEEESPRAITKAESELESLQLAQTRDEALLAKLESDRTQFEITAPDDGWLYHGSIENARWTVGEAAKTLVPKGKAAVRRPLATFIPQDSALTLVARLEAAVAGRIDGSPLAAAWLEGREDAAFNAKLEDLSPAPDAESLHKAVFAAEWPDEKGIAPASQVHIHMITYHSPAAILLPVKALQFDPEGWTVAVKLADGKTERRVVERGRVFNNMCEIVSGLEAGQVVVLP